MIECTKKNCPFGNLSECMITTGCPFYTNEAIDKSAETIANVVSELISKIKQHNAIDVMQEIKNQIEKMQTYKLFIGNGDKYIDRDEVLRLIDEKIKECDE